MLTVYVTGATGFIGRAVCARMLESGWRVRGVCRKGTSADILPAGVEVLLFVIAIIIKLTSRGPVFYCSDRVGKNNKLFK